MELVIVQPLARGSAVRRWEIDREEFLSWIPEIERDVEAALDPDTPLNPGSWCQFCRAAPSCEALREQSLITTQADFSDLNIHPDELQGAELAAALGKITIVETWAKAVRDHAFSVASRGGNVPGFKLVQSAQRENGKVKNGLQLF